MVLENMVLRKVCGVGENGAEEDMCCWRVCCLERCGVGVYDAEEGMWCWRVWC
jgi:hypothetical protein